MTDRYIAFTVTLAEPTRDDDSQAIIDAIKMIRGVHDVVPVVADAQTYWAKATARTELVTEVLKLLSKEPK